jgi:hypothetical protein
MIEMWYGHYPSSSGQGSAAGCCEGGTESSGSIMLNS